LEGGIQDTLNPSKLDDVTETEEGGGISKGEIVEVVVETVKEKF